MCIWIDWYNQIVYTSKQQVLDSLYSVRPFKNFLMERYLPDDIFNMSEENKAEVRKEYDDYLALVGQKILDGLDKIYIDI